MSDEKEDKEFEVKLAAKNHKELKTKLEAIANALSKDDDSKIVAAIEKQTTALSEYSLAIKQLPKQDTPQVSVQVNQDKVISSLENIAKDITNSNEALLAELKRYNERPILESFKVVKDTYGNTKSIDLVYKKK